MALAQAQNQSLLIVGVVTSSTTQTTSGWYPMVLELQMRGKKVRGTSLYLVPTQWEDFVCYSLEGEREGDTYHLTEKAVLKATAIEGVWLRKAMTLTVTDEHVQGEWEDIDGFRQRGEVRASIRPLHSSGKKGKKAPTYTRPLRTDASPGS